jgi:hypothetical protein
VKCFNQLAFLFVSTSSCIPSTCSCGQMPRAGPAGLLQSKLPTKITHSYDQFSGNLLVVLMQAAFVVDPSRLELRDGTCHKTSQRKYHDDDVGLLEAFLAVAGNTVAVAV